MPRSLALVVIVSLSIPLFARADAFDRLEGQTLTGLPGSPKAQQRKSLTFGDLGTLPPVLEGVRSPLVIVETGDGNPARLLATGALRRPPAQGAGEPAPVLVLERYDTFEAGPATTKLAWGRDVVLFDGFEFDLDTGQVVPDGQGGDLRFTTAGEAGPRLEPVGDARLYTLTEPPLAGTPEPGQPSPGTSVLPADFAGRYHLVADGRWSGLLVLEVDDQGTVTGRFRSDQTGNAYRVSGQAGVGEPNHLVFAIDFPRSRQEYDARLWTEGKGALAGTVNLLERTFGFFALREGGRFAPADAEVENVLEMAPARTDPVSQEETPRRSPPAERGPEFRQDRPTGLDTPR